MTLDGLAAWRMLFEGQVRHFLAVGRAHGAFLCAADVNIEDAQNDKAFSLSSSLGEVGLWPKSVTWARFGRGIKRVRDLHPQPTK